MELTKSLQETLDGMKLTVKYSTDNKNDVMCAWESGDAQSQEAITIILHKKIDFQNILSKSGIPENTLYKVLKIYLEESKDIFDELDKIMNENYSDLEKVCHEKRGIIQTAKFGI